MGSLLPMIAAGAALGVAFTLSPLTVLVLTAIAVLLWRVSRKLPADECRWFLRLFGAALLLRVAAIGVLFLVSPHDSQGSALLFGDEAYALARSWRVRNVLLDIPQLKYDYVIAYEFYGKNTFLYVMSYLQVLAGPAPYGLRVLNAAMYVGAVSILFRITRAGFGAFTAFAGALTLLFLPTLFFWSISLLKEPFYFVLTAATLAAVVDIVQTRSWRRRTLAAAIFAVSLFLLRDLRTGAVALVVAGIGMGFIGAYVVARRWRIAVAAGVAALAMASVFVVPALQRRAIAAVDDAAATQSGHVFTVGHGYKLLDEGYYVVPGIPTFSLRPDEAARYVVRAVAAYLFVPLPWQIATRSEMAYLPEQLFWYALVVLSLFGVAEAMKRDRLLGSLLISYILPTAAVVALTTGNVGTLIRHRTLIVPYLVWISALGFGLLLQRLTAGRPLPESAILAPRS